MLKQTYKIPEENIESLQKKIKTLNNKANKLVGQSITINQVGEEYIQDNETKEYNKLIIIEITGAAPHYDGYEFIATLNHNYSSFVLFPVFIPLFQGI